jgi:negative regulator of sigma E activity
MRRPAVLVLVAVAAAALAVTTWLVRELRTASESSADAPAVAPPPGAPASR